MYIPSHFEQRNPEVLAELMQRHSFATVISHDGKAPFATHMPVLFHPNDGPRGTLVTHMARANPQWRQFDGMGSNVGREVLVIFHGPHAYISPSWYVARPAVPTWNYTAVHAYGVPRIVEDPVAVRNILRELVNAFESHRHAPYSELTDAYIDKLSPAIVAIEIPLTRLEGKFKLNQNRSREDVTGVIDALSASHDQTERELADVMKSRALGDI
jgi:transcriptional regulator